MNYEQEHLAHDEIEISVSRIIKKCIKKKSFFNFYSLSYLKNDFFLDNTFFLFFLSCTEYFRQNKTASADFSYKRNGIVQRFFILY